VVKRVEVGPFRLIDKSTKLETTEEVMTNVIIEHKGYDVSVGSGFSVEERRLFSDNPDLIIGKEITVQYFEESSNKDSELSLRFPTIKKIWLDGRRNI
jgi:DNA ligase-1